MKRLLLTALNPACYRSYHKFADRKGILRADFDLSYYCTKCHQIVIDTKSVRMNIPLSWIKSMYNFNSDSYFPSHDIISKCPHCGNKTGYMCCDTFYVDKDIIHIVDEIYRKGYTLWASCAGHINYSIGGKYWYDQTYFAMNDSVLETNLFDILKSDPGYLDYFRMEGDGSIRSIDHYFDTRSLAEKDQKFRLKILSEMVHKLPSNGEEIPKRKVIRKGRF